MLTSNNIPAVTVDPHTVKITKKKSSSNKDQWDIKVNNVLCGHAKAIYKTKTQRTWDIHFDEDKIPDFASNLHTSYPDNHTINKGLQLAIKDVSDYGTLAPGHNVV